MEKEIVVHCSQPQKTVGQWSFPFYKKKWIYHLFIAMYLPSFIFQSLARHNKNYIPTTVGRTPLDEWSACRRDLYLTTHNTHNKQTFMSPVGFEPTISAGEQPQTYALDRVATGTGKWGVTIRILQLCSVCLSLTLCVMYLVTLYNSRSHFEIAVDPLIKWLKRWSVHNTRCPVLPHDVYIYDLKGHQNSSALLHN